MPKSRNTSRTRVEKSLYKLHENLLDIAGSLTCLWADLSVTNEQILLLPQLALVLVGSTAHHILQERRSLAEEDYTKKEFNLFGPGFHLGLFMQTPPQSLDSLPTAGRLAHCIQAWSQLSLDPWILESVRGYILELEGHPVQHFPPTNRAIS